MAITYRIGETQVGYAYRDLAGWHAEVAGTDIRAWTISLVLGAAGRADIAVGAEGLYYLVRDAGVWRQEKVASEAFSASLGVSAGVPRIAFTRTGEVALATRSGSGWQIETVGAGERTYYASLALDSLGVPHVAYYEGASPAHLYYSRRLPDGWHTTDTGRTDSDLDQHVTLVLAGAVPVLAECRDCDNYSYAPHGRVDITRLEPGGPQTETAAQSHTVGQVQRLAVDGSGKAHLVYSDGVTGRPVYAYEAEDGWRSERIAAATDTDALALDGTGRPHLAYRDAQGVHYGLRDTAGWHFELVQSAPVQAGSPALALDSTDQPHLGWADETGVRVAARVAGQWAAERAYTGPANARVIVDTDSEDGLQVAFGDTAHLRFAYPYDGKWYRAYPAPLRLTVDPSSLSAGPGGKSYVGHVVDCGSTEGNPYMLPAVAVRSGQKWQVEEVAPCDFETWDRFVGPVSLAVDNAGTVYAAWGTNWGYKLHLARRTPAGWEGEVIATAIIDSDYDNLPVSLAFDGAGKPTISYFDPDIRGIRVLRRVDVPATPTPTPTPTQAPAACSTPTPAAPYTGVPPASGSIQRQVVNCADDTYVRVDTQEQLYTLTYVRMGARDGGAIDYVSGFLFRDVRIPRGADVVSARLQVQPEGHYSGATVQVSIAGELHGQSGDFNPNNWWANTRPRTVARVPWSVPATTGTAVESPDISAIVEEIVALPDWQPGNNIAILIDATDATNAWINWHAYDGKPAAAGQLSLTYQPK